MKKTSTRLRYFQFIKEFAQYKKKNVFLVCGNDEYQKDQCLILLKREYVSPETEDFDAVTLYGTSCENTDLREQLESLPFMAKKRFVLVKEFDHLKKLQREGLEKYLTSPQKTTVLVIIADKLDMRTSLAHKLSSAAVIVECKKPYNNSNLLSWLDMELKKTNTRMDRPARNYLVSNIELDYQAAANELTKLLIFTRNSGKITLDDVKKTLGGNRNCTIYDLQRSLGKRNLKESENILQNMINAEDASSIGVMLVAMLNRYFLTLWKIISFRLKGYKDYEISQNHLYEVFYSFRDEYLQAAKNFNRRQIRKTFSYLLAADTELKSINMETETLFLLIWKICHA